VAVFCYHWPRMAHFLAALGVPLCVALIVWIAMQIDRPDADFDWAWPYVLGDALVQMVGGVLGVMAGRPIARGLIRVLLPPGLRQVLAFIWLVDGKVVPGVEALGAGRKGHQ
jgi:hypothetical protein